MIMSSASAAAGEYLLNVLIINKPTYKGLIVPGGKVDMMFTAKGFGKEDGEQICNNLNGTAVGAAAGMAGWKV
jgi:hypothetical protein